MNKFTTLFDKNSEAILSLTRNLHIGNSNSHRNKLDSLLTGSKEKKIKKKKDDAKFQSHPNRFLSSDSSQSDVDNSKSISQNTLSSYINNNKSGTNLTLTFSENSMINPNDVLNQKTSSKRITFNPNSSFCSDTKLSVKSQKIEVAGDRQNCRMRSALKKSNPSSSTHVLFNEARAKEIVVESSISAKENRKTKVDQKIHTLFQRILSCLEDIKMLIDMNVAIPDGKEDWERRRTRAMEFSSRFGRNYLYQIGRQLNELQKSTKRSGTISNNSNVQQHFLGAYQTVLQAFQAYHCHIPTSLQNTNIDKLRSVGEQTLKLSEIYNKYRAYYCNQNEINNEENSIEFLIKGVKVLLDKIKTINTMDVHSNCPVKTAVASCKNIKQNKKKKSKVKKNAYGGGKYSMYSTNTNFQKNYILWNSMENLLGPGYTHIQSRYKTGSFKHRPPTEKPTVIEIPQKSKLLPKRSSHILKNTPVTTPHNEDDIQTMIEIDNRKECNNNVAQPVEHKKENDPVKLKTVKPLLQELCQQMCSKETQAMTQKQLEDLVKGLLEMALDGKVDNSNDTETRPKKNGFSRHSTKDVVESLMQNSKTALVKCLTSNEYKESNPPSDVTLHKTISTIDFNNAANFDEIKESRSGQSITTNQKRQTVTVSGAENAQLICIYDENSIVDSSDEEEPAQTNAPVDNNTVHSKSSMSRKNILSCNTLNEDSGNKSNAENEPSRSKSKNEINVKKPKVGTIKISRLPKKSLKQLTFIPKNYAMNIIQYKMKYGKFTKGNHMYQKNTKIQPWLVVNEISDHLLDDLLSSVAQEIQVDNILESLYHSEFQ